MASSSVTNIDLGAHTRAEATTVERASQQTTRVANDADIAKLNDLIKDNHFCMLTTEDESGFLHSRPMAPTGERIKVEDGTPYICFFTYRDSHKCAEMQAHGWRCNISFQDSSHQRYVSLSGNAKLVQDRAELEKRWAPTMNAWFPNGLDTPGCCLLKVELKRAELWDEPTSIIATAVAFVTSQMHLAGGGPEKLKNIGDHRSLVLESHPGGVAPTPVTKLQEEKSQGRARQDEIKMSDK